ncbi:MAG: ABC transporter ATP-binding protein [Bacillota bacterium]|uniref:ABC transporter ATP-binding protein n=1 Tax=Virgibacillus TaxID=84406 RepID=UPI00041CE63E|nr:MULTISPECIES: ABC transporter ATP-binding protein [Bacillaceae]MCC2251410.1 ABC transporter ATP-binding protein [Virgibacillus sp. AGTR]MDY7042783.1 ABC transporter ATP-binding protein [Virgibacillus sp. M23]QRZ18113.1 ABC transporter ATP-binding protein [Virgibacillus sp. AGTR]WBX78563.1 ABC transporter ATP-binding protein [Virgibacillus salarius]
MSTVNLSAITKQFGDVTAVEELDILIKEGEFFTFLGPSGCGKTTTLRMIAGFYYPTKGKVTFNDKDMTTVPPEKRNTGMVFQNYALFPHMTVFENVAFGLKVRKITKSQTKKRVEDILKKVRLDQYMDRQVSQLSGGQQQRVALARALVIEPDILLLDEPLSNLDARLRDEMRNEILRLQRDYGITTIYVTHDQAEALTMSDRIAVFNMGKCQQVGTPTEIYNQPVNDFVAEFIGETNLIPIAFKEEKNNEKIYHCEQLDADIQVQATEVNIAEYNRNDQLLMSIRPESVQIDKASLTGENVFKGEVILVQFTGASVHTYIKLSSDAIIRATDLNEGPSTYLTNGSKVNVKLPADQIRVIPKARM